MSPFENAGEIADRVQFLRIGLPEKWKPSRFILSGTGQIRDPVQIPHAEFYLISHLPAFFLDTHSTQIRCVRGLSRDVT
jgi:hypothetical protein